MCERAYLVHKQTEYKRLSEISISHIYNLKQSKAYQQIRGNFDKTKPKASIIGERKKT